MEEHTNTSADEKKLPEEAPFSEENERFAEPEEIPEISEGADAETPAEADIAPPSLEETVGGEAFLPLEEGLPAEEIEPEEKKSETKLRRFFRKFIRWAAGLLIVFGLGLLTGIFVLYRPATNEANRAIRVHQTDLDSANAQISDLQSQISSLESEIASLQPLKERNDELLAEQANFNLHIAILDARLDVANALLALSQDDSAKASIILENTSGTLTEIGDLLEPEQQDAVTAMKQRLDLVLGEMEDDPYAAQSDLDVLAANLLQLEDSLIPE